MRPCGTCGRWSSKPLPRPWEFKDVVFLRYPDGDLASAGELRHRLVVLIRRWRPDMPLTWDAWRPYQLHPDHRATGLAGVEAVLAAGNPRQFHSLVADSLPAHRVGEVYLFGTDNPDQRTYISETFELKLKAIACHRSQVGDAAGAAAQVDGCAVLTNSWKPRSTRDSRSYAPSVRGDAELESLIEDQELQNTSRGEGFQAVKE